MAEFLILGQQVDKQSNKDYLGTYRQSPEYVDGLTNDAKVNRLWEWYVHMELSHLGVDAQDLKMAQNLVLEYRGLEKIFNIIEVSSHKDNLQFGEFIGYDLSYKNFDSMLSWGLKFHTSLPLLKLVEYHFSTKLNKYGLLEEYEEASFLLEVLKTIHSYQPEMFEPYLDKFQVIAVGLVVIPSI